MALISVCSTFDWIGNCNKWVKYDLDLLQSQANSNTTNIATLNTKLTTTNTNLATTNTNLSNTNTTVNALNTSLSSTKASVNTLTTNLSTTNTSVNDLTTKVTTNTTDLASLKTQFNALPTTSTSTSWLPAITSAESASLTISFLMLLAIAFGFKQMKRVIH